jgi:hypothetical protein
VVNNVVNNKVTIVGYGKEDTSKIDEKYIMSGFKNGYFSPIKLTEAIHFNPKYPEFNNIYIASMKDKYAMCFDGKRWELIDKDELIEKIYEDKKNFIEENLEEYTDKLTNHQKESLDRWLNTNENHEKIKEVKNKLKLLLYNRRDIPLNTKNGIAN